jgi:hypothetical protein
MEKYSGIRFKERDFTIFDDFIIPAWGGAAFAQLAYTLGDFEIAAGARLDYEFSSMEYDCRSLVHYTTKKNSIFYAPLLTEFVGKTEKNRLICTTCGHATVFDKNYCADGKTISELHAEQMEYLKTLKDYCFEQKTTIHRFDKRRGVMTERGEGICRLTEGAIVYEGTEDGKEVRYEKTPAELQALIYTEGKHFQFYEGKELCFFYPEDRNACAKWSMLWDILRERVMYSEKLRAVRRDLEKAESELVSSDG